ncbi:hypothetical protein QWY82_10175 [Simiduia curdlanivorans]|uniref:Uncharacterized protein n=1 Tax=Simiduia curdlanivorans TaxID=1492769 RepID=A0ABV8V132_9GAMM|nr:hypothetical protein [Simiduia curdlanivorans]MDN3639176.1 hypothetical protein [Simiduia curdlanivorans]
MSIETSNNLHSPELKLESLQLDFEFAPSLHATGFRQVNPQRYVATVKNVWVFRELFVEVESNNGFNSPEDVSVRVSLVDITSNMRFDDFPTGPEIFSGQGLVHDVSPRVLADEISVEVASKRVTLQLMDRLGTNKHTLPTPGNDRGFEIRANWLGHGAKTFYIEPGIPEPEYAHFRAIGFVVETVQGPEGEDHFIQIKYQPIFPGAAPLLSAPIFLNQKLDEVYGPL